MENLRKGVVFMPELQDVKEAHAHVWIQAKYHYQDDQADSRGLALRGEWENQDVVNQLDEPW